MIKAVFLFEDGTVTVHSENTKEVTEKFPSGYYSTLPTNNGGLTITKEEFHEVHEPFPNQRSSEIIDSTTKFLDSELRARCNEMGYTYKLNCLVYGSQGVGKTALLNYIASTLVTSHNSIVFRIDNPGTLEPTWRLAEEIRKIQENPIIFIMDEFDQYTTKSNEAYIKNLLDGNRSIDNSMVLAATNYIDRIPKALKERPSRFRIVSRIEPISDKDVIRQLVLAIHSKSSIPFLSDEEIEHIVSSTENTTVDSIKTAIVDILTNMSIDLPVEKGVSFSKRKVASDKEKKELFNVIMGEFERKKEIEEFEENRKYELHRMDKPPSEINIFTK